MQTFYSIGNEIHAVYMHTDTVCSAANLRGWTFVVQKPVVVTSAANSNNIPCSPQSVARGQLYFPFAGDKSRFYECDLQGSPIVVNCPSVSKRVDCGSPVSYQTV